jgi:hypothetical protein
MLNNKGIFHPLFAYHPRNALAGSQQTLVEVRKPTGASAQWTPGVGMANTTLALVWRGYARVQPNIDWRARTRDHGNEFNATHAVRIQLGIGKNLVGATFDVDGSVLEYGVDPEFAKDYVVTIVESNVTGTQGLVGKDFVVRNALHNDQTWVYNLLCDTGTK